MGGDGPTTFDRVIEFCDGWMPIAGRAGSTLLEKIATLRRRAAAAGRDPKTISISIFGARADKAALTTLAEAGVDRAIFNAPSASHETLLPLLDEYAELIR
jgi:alkanesulfonate monooxygenase SsuD/methylene tetrahydromethanopterin reductase-like flavin-dependent oxidoreductase (luciferase family)